MAPAGFTAVEDAGRDVVLSDHAAAAPRFLKFRDSRPTAALAVALLAIGVYANSLWNGFALDDNFIILTNDRVHQLSDLREILLRPYWPFWGQELGLYRPFIMLVYAVQWAIGNGAAWVFHVFNVLFHAIASVLVFLLLDRYANRLPAFLGALLFAVHPVHTESVANIVGQAEIVAAIVVLSACLVHASRPPGMIVSWPRRIAIAFLFLIAIATKENTVVLPALLVISDLVQRRVPLTWPGMKRYVDAMFTTVVLLGAGLVVYLLVRFYVLGSITGVDAAPAMPFLREEYRVLNALRAFPEFLRLLLFPLDLSADYAPAVILPVEEIRPLVIFGAAQLALVVVIALFTPWRPFLGFPAAWFILTILTVSNLFFPIGVLVAERTLYLPSFAVSALLAFAWQAAAPHASGSMRRLAPVVLALVLLGLGVRTWIRNPDWKDTWAVANAMIRDHPESYKAQWVYASRLLAIAKRPDQAREHFLLAYRIYHRDGRFLSDYANFLVQEGRYDAAIPILESVYPEEADVNFFARENSAQLAYAYIATGRFRDALRMIQRSERIGEEVRTTAVYRAYAFTGLGEHDRAIAAWRLAMQQPGFATWHTRALLARSLAWGGYPHAAAASLDSIQAATSDSAAAAVLNSAERALASGCYAPTPARDSALAAGFGIAEKLACDPLPELFVFHRPAQNASALQNAMPPEWVRPEFDPARRP